MLTLILDENGRGVGVGDATGVPGYVLGPNEVECTPEQYAHPTAWTLKDGNLVAAPDLPQSAPMVADVTSAQAKIALSRAGHLADVKRAVEATGGEVEIWFTDARMWQRTNPHIASIGGALHLSDADIDDLFVAASKIAA